MVSRQVILDRDYRYISVFQSPFIGVFAFILIDKFPGEPVIFPSQRIGPLVKILFPVGVGLPANFYSLDFRTGKLRDIDIENNSLGKFSLQGLPGNYFYKSLGRIKISIYRMVEKRKADGRNSLCPCFNCSTHSS